MTVGKLQAQQIIQSSKKPDCKQEGLIKNCSNTSENLRSLLFGSVVGMIGGIVVGTIVKAVAAYLDSY